MRLFARTRYESDYLKVAQQEEIKKAKHAFWNLEIMRLIQGLAGLSLICGMIFTLINGWIKGLGHFG